jgi:hypothetical protein
MKDHENSPTALAERKRRFHLLLPIALFAILAALVVYACVDLPDLKLRLLRLPAPASLPLMAALGVAVGVAVDTSVHWLRKRLKARETPVKPDELAGHFLGIMGLIYAVVVGFVVASAWQDYDHVAEMSIQEERDASNLFQIVDAYARSDTAARKELARIHDGVKLYAFDMQGEWKQMERNERLCSDEYACKDHTQSSYFVSRGSDEMANEIYSLPAESLNELSFKDELSAAVTDLLALKNHRRHHYTEGGLPPSLWFAFIIGAVILIGTSYFVGNQDASSQRVRTCAFFAMIFMMFTLTAMFENPFTGAQRLPVGTEWCNVYETDRHLEVFYTDVGQPRECASSAAVFLGS